MYGCWPPFSFSLSLRGFASVKYNILQNGIACVLGLIYSRADTSLTNNRDGGQYIVVAAVVVQNIVVAAIVVQHTVEATGAFLCLASCSPPDTCTLPSALRPFHTTGKCTAGTLICP